jgi:GTP-dependent phosphoenolpyruvate carboxykinase
MSPGLTETYFEEFGEHVPDALRDELAALRSRLK